MVALLCLSMTAPSPAAKVTIDRNIGSDASPAFKFKHVPSPVKENAASGAKLKLVVGEADDNGAGLTALNDGVLPIEEDDLERNFFFAAGSNGGRVLMDLGRSIDIAQVNTYSWHPNTRGPQVYTLFASDGADPKFNREPGDKTHPANCGWKLIASVDTRSSGAAGGGQYGVSIGNPSASLGKFRYLLFDVVPTEMEDDWGNTFFSEINVIPIK